MNANLPIDFTNRMKEMLGDEYDAFMQSYDLPHFRGLRFNPLKNENISGYVRGEGISGNTFALQPVPWCKSGYYYDENMTPGKHPLHAAGAYYIQEPSAMAVGETVGKLIKEWYDKHGDSRDIRILDLCAAPGGKTTHIAGYMKGRGILVANEIVPSRAAILSQNVERMGIRNCVVTNESPDSLAKHIGAFFDIVVVDTPCSGEGMMRRDDIARTEWSPQNVQMCAKRGQEILDYAEQMLLSGGKLVYSTCTFAVEEDEMAICNFINNHISYKVVPIVGLCDEKTPDMARDEKCDCMSNYPISAGRAIWSDGSVEGIEYTMRLWPHILQGEGHYLAVMQKGEDEDIVATARDDRNVIKGKDVNSIRECEKMWQVLSKDILVAECELRECSTDRLRLFGDNLYLIPHDCICINGVKTLRVGLHLAIVKKDRLEPAHAMAAALRTSELKQYVRLDTDSADAGRFLSGESLGIDDKLVINDEDDRKENGWMPVTVGEYTLGWGKRTGAILKNHYPKGLRIMR